MKRLLDEAEASFDALTGLVESAERYEPSPFTKAALKTRITRGLGLLKTGSRAFNPALLGAAGLLLAATAAAAGYALVGSRFIATSARAGSPLAAASAQASAAAPASAQAESTTAPPPQSAAPAAPAPAASDANPEVADAASPRSAGQGKDVSSAAAPRRSLERPRAGEDPTQVAEAVRALRKQGNFARAQALLDRYLKDNPRGALAEDALALSIEAASARKDARAAEYARRYLARYPHGRFRAVAERALSK